MKDSVRKAFEALVGGEFSETLRSEPKRLLFSRERQSRPQSLTRDALIEHAQSLAHDQIAEVSGRGSRELFHAFAGYCKKIEEAHAILSDAKDLLTPGAEWLLDNYHVIQEQIGSIKRDFPRGYDRTLPKLLSGRHKGYPRVYEIALEVLSKSDAVVDTHPLSSFISGYQSVSQLTLGELWAVPIMLRFALVENVSNLADRFVAVREERKLAEQFIDEIIGDETRAGTEILLVLASRLRAAPELLNSSAPYLIRRLRERGRKATITLQWLEERLREEGAEPDEILRAEQYALAADQISIGNSVTALKAIGYVDWQSWVESVSIVERTLRRDSVYAKSDFKTRDKCRHTIERLAKRGKALESTIAEAAIQMATSASVEDKDPRAAKKRSATYYLLDGAGISALEKKIGLGLGFSLGIARFLRSNAIVFYSLSILLLTLLFLAPFSVTRLSGVSEILIVLALIVTASELGVNCLQFLITRLVPPAYLPKLDFQNGIPAEFKTIVVVHSLFGDIDSAATTIESIEVRYLANAEEHVVFGILADFRDADSETLANDSEIFAFAKRRIQELNDRHGHRFFILFRKRRFNPGQGKWMAWERKRGKVEQFNEMLMNPNHRGDFIITDEEVALLSDARYVVTLDNDSQLPRGAVQRLVGTAAHPLNTPIFDEKRRVVTEGFSIIQPRIGTTLTSAHASPFARIFCGQAGLDPYSETVSELYQDVFGEGTYTGKGLYDIKAFEHALAGRVPENALLSHDLFEGNFARVGLASDIELFDDYPSKYHVHARRHHRWVRGDWQLLPWLRAKVPAAKNRTERNAISALGRFKIIDNLRRSLVAPSLFLALVLSWLFAEEINEITLFVLLVILFPVVANVAQAFIIPPRRTSSFGSHVRGVGRDILLMCKQAAFTLAVLPHQTMVMTDAISRTLYRVFISRKNMLEWETAASADRRLRADLGSFVREMRAGFVVTLILAIIVATLRVEIFLWNLPIFILWLSAPWFAFSLSSPQSGEREDFSPENREYITRVAWDTWRYFREIVGEENNYLVPDNIQLVPNRVVANRTSPTNISLSMLSAVSAYELGFFTLNGVSDRIEKTLDSLGKLERFRGHLLNWYDCVRLAPLSPRYVSTVDSGNLIGHFVALRVFLDELEDRPLYHDGHREHAKRLFGFEGFQDSNLVTTSVGSIILTLPELEIDKSKLRNTRSLRDIEDLLESKVYFADLAKFREALEPAELVQLESDFAVPTSPKQILSLIAKLEQFVAGLARDRQGELLGYLTAAKQKIEELVTKSKALSGAVTKFILEHDLQFLYDTDRNLFSIGYHVDHARRDGSFYDLLASEARLSALVAVALGQVPEKHWFSLGRALADSAGGPLLLSWSGTMFEYLMPIVVMKDFPGTLLSESYKAVIRAQKSYAERKGVPWGISESSFSGVDFEKTYQYRAFGVPGLGLKRGLEDDLVISPYSTALALMVAPLDALKNLKSLENEGARGEYGFFEAVDYTPARLSGNEKKHIVQNFFAHHQGMSLCSMANLLSDQCIQELFHRDPIIRATELLLQERFPDRIATVSTPELQPADVERDEELTQSVNATVFDTPHTLFPRTHLISNGALSTMVDNSGSGYLAFDRDFSLTRWREDLVQNKFGTYLYLRDRESGFSWSSTYQPTCVEPESYEAVFSPDKVEFKRRDRNIYAHTEIVVSPEDNVEIRKLSLINLSGEKRRVEVTSFGEVALNNVRADMAHPAFSKMFIQSEFLPEFDCILLSRRPRSAKESPQFLFHMLTMKTVWERVEFESSRFSFVGRGRDLSNPQALLAPLSGSHGSVLDPVFSLRTGLEVEPGHAESCNFISGYAKSRDEALSLIRRYKELHQISRAFEMAWSQASVELRNEQMSVKLFSEFQKLGNALLFNIHPLRGPGEIIQRNRLAQQSLWRFGISGDLPIVTVRITEPGQVKLVQELLAAHHYLRVRGLAFDLVILNEYPGGYLQTLQEELDYVIRSSLSGSLMERGIFLRSLTQMSDEERELLNKVSRIALNGSQGTLQQQLKFDEREIASPPRRVVTRPKAKALTGHYELSNSYGGFTDAGKSYAVEIGGSTPPLPYANVIANPHFGFLVTESGGGYTWSDNSRENRITPWSNDPISDPVSEVVFLRDTKSGDYWSLTPRPASHGGEYQTVHRFGESEFSTDYDGIESKLRLSISSTDKVKFSIVSLKNKGKKTRSVELFFYAELVLGVSREEMARYQSVVFDTSSQALFTSNSYNGDFPGRVVAVSSSHPIAGYTGSRSDFIGRNRSLASPLAFDASETETIRLSRRVGSGFDPCSVIKVVVEVPPGGKEDVSFILGEYASADAARTGVAAFRTIATAEQEIHSFRDEIAEVTGALEVTTPSRTFDLILNGWLSYQIVSSRLYGRTGLYQSGGAIGFRDQLQDVLALLYSKPELVRAQLLLHASRQFPEGDVQHWWHPPSGKGVRTKISDDFLWLPLVAARYIEATNDYGILEEIVPFIDGPILGEHEHEAYIVPRVSERSASFYEHCVRALERGLNLGSHGLPLMGVGDWNDGMNEVGKDGKGESVWLGWFTALCLKEFLPLVELRQDSGEVERVERYRGFISQLAAAVEDNAWDGGWYRRAYFDDGTPLGSAQNDECQIDSLPQTWSVLSGLGRKERQEQAMHAVYDRLVDDELQLIKLFDPPFDTGTLKPGYIKGYLPGVRENGGQYTHAAVWVVMAAAKLGDGDRAFKYFQYINPVSHTSNKEDADVYMGEPYVLCGDVYAAPPFEGRAGWSWYTGSAGWLYQAGISSILGLELHPDGFEIKPCIPSSWPEYKMNYKRNGTRYEIVVKNPNGRSGGDVVITAEGSSVVEGRVQFSAEKIVRVTAVIQ